jgi:hypothetical protein
MIQYFTKPVQLSLVVSMKITIVSCVVVLTILLGCSSSISSISSEDLRQMKEQSEYLLTIDSSRCTPDLIRLLKMQSCYKIAQLNQKYRNCRMIHDSTYTQSYVPDRFINGKYVYDKTQKITYYKIRYRAYNGDKPLRNNITFRFDRDTITHTLYCSDILENWTSHYIGARYINVEENYDDDIP